MRFLLHLLAFTVTAVAPVAAQPTFFGGEPPPDPDDLVQWNGPAVPVAVVPGKAASVRLDLRVADGWHVYALDSPTGIPLRIEASLPPGFRVSGVNQSPPIDTVDPTLGESVRWFKREGTFDVAVLASAEAAVGESPATVKIRFGVCDDRICLPPQDRTIPIKLTVAAPATRADANGIAEPTVLDTPLVDTVVPTDTAAAVVVLAPSDDAGDALADQEVRAPPSPGESGGGLGRFLAIAISAGVAALLAAFVVLRRRATYDAVHRSSGSNEGRS